MFSEITVTQFSPNETNCSTIKGSDFMLTNHKMHIGFDVSQTGSGKAGCGFFAHAMIQAILEIDPEHRYSLYSSFGDFYFMSFMPIQNHYNSGNLVHTHLTR